MAATLPSVLCIDCGMACHFTTIHPVPGRSVPGPVGNVRSVPYLPAGRRASPPPPRPARADLLVTLVAVALAVWVTSGMWRDPNQRAITVNSSDQALFEWLLAFGGHALTHGENPLFTHLINVPDGVNLAVNTSITVYAAVFAPLTYLIGPPATFLVILTLNLAATALAWYWLLSRHLVGSRLAAGVGRAVRRLLARHGRRTPTRT